MNILEEALRLHGLGFAVLWIKPKSKAPVKSKWTTGPRESLKDLKASYRKGMNVGVRLGTPSKIGDKFLAVIDVDVKSTDPKHRAQAEEEIKKYFPTLGETVKVLSGRGNGSSHIYVLTSQPAVPKKIATSKDKVRALMPSAPISNSQRELLSEEDLNEGYRMRPAWEISIMGEGQQVLLPPSVHPDTRKEYLWQVRLKSVSNLKELEFSSNKKDTSRSVTSDWKPVPVDLANSRLNDEIYVLIVDGDCEDRSAGLFKAAIAMIREGFTDHEIMSVLTDTDYRLGEVAYEHAKTESRARAANWIFNYTIKKARSETDASIQFESEVETVLLSPEASAEQSAELLLSDDWKNLLSRNGPSGANANAPRNTLGNTILILTHEVGPGIFKRNEFSNQDVYGCETPWGGRADQEVTDTDVVLIKTWIAKRFRYEPSSDRITEAIIRIAHDNRFHPVRDYLDSLPCWDGVSRISTWLRDHLGARGPEPYLSAVSRKTLVAMIARVMEPGTKFDYVLILEGNQGIGKSTALRHLVGDAWFTDNKINISDKDGVLGIQAIWLSELGELSSMKKADVDDLKAFVSRTVDKIRVPYGKRVQGFGRQCIFVGTTNKDEYLTDLTGNRRFWPVRVGEYDFKSILKMRDQLFAEALLYYELGEPLYLEDESSKKSAIEEQSNRTFHDSLIQEIDEFLNSKPEGFDVKKFTTSDLFKFGPCATLREDRTNQMRVGEALKFLLYSRKRGRDEKGNLKWFYSKN